MPDDITKKEGLVKKVTKAANKALDNSLSSEFDQLGLNKEKQNTVSPSPTPQEKTKEIYGDNPYKEGTDDAHRRNITTDRDTNLQKLGAQYEQKESIKADEGIKKRLKRNKILELLSLPLSAGVAAEQFNNTGNINLNALPTNIVTQRRKDIMSPYIEERGRVQKANDALNVKMLDERIKNLNDKLQTPLSPTEKLRTERELEGYEEDRQIFDANLNKINSQVKTEQSRQNTETLKQKAIKDAKDKPEEQSHAEIASQAYRTVSKQLKSAGMDYLHNKSVEKYGLDKEGNPNYSEDQLYDEAIVLMDELTDVAENAKGEEIIVVNKAKFQELINSGLKKEEINKLIAQRDALRTEYGIEPGVTLEDAISQKTKEYDTVLRRESKAKTKAEEELAPLTAAEEKLKEAQSSKAPLLDSDKEAQKEAIGNMYSDIK